MYLILAYIVSWSIQKTDSPWFQALSVALVLFFLYNHYHFIDVCQAKTCADHSKVPALIENSCVCLEVPK